MWRFCGTILLAFVSVVVQGKVYVTIEGNAESCFEELSEAGIRGSFECVKGGTIDVTISTVPTKGNGETEILLRSRATPKGDFEFPSPTNQQQQQQQHRYQLCFSNRNSNAAKVVGFSLHGKDEWMGNDDDEVAKTVDTVLPLSTTLSQLSSRLETLQDHERYLSERMQRHMETAKSTSVRVVGSMCVEAIVLLAVNMFQILYLKRYFERKRKF